MQEPLQLGEFVLAMGNASYTYREEYKRIKNFIARVANRTIKTQKRRRVRTEK